MEIEGISSKIQNKIIIERLYDSGYQPKDICNLQIQGLSRSTIYRVWDLVDNGEDLKEKSRSGRPKLLNEEEILLIADYMDENPGACVPDLMKYVSEELGKDVSDFTLRRTLKDLGLVYKEPKVGSFLSDGHKELRLKWALEHQKCSWDRVLFTDEATFWLGKSGVACWKPFSEMNEHMLPKNIPKVQVWGGFSQKGKVSLCLFYGNMDSIFYVSILEEKLSEMRRCLKKPQLGLISKIMIPSIPPSSLMIGLKQIEFIFWNGRLIARISTP